MTAKIDCGIALHASPLDGDRRRVSMYRIQNDAIDIMMREFWIDRGPPASGRLRYITAGMMAAPFIGHSVALAGLTIRDTEDNPCDNVTWTEFLVPGEAERFQVAKYLRARGLPEHIVREVATGEHWHLIDKPATP